MTAPPPPVDRPGDETVELITWSGRLHKFGPERMPPTPGRWAKPYRVARCNKSITTDEHTQTIINQQSVCSRCFPAAARGVSE